ncbi:MAG: hypothetical protein E6543_11720, partial [Enterobacter hormaechei]|nr:hypothetical protein [Enterobacter hormaechei]
DYGMMFSGQSENRHHYRDESCRFNGEIIEKTAMTRYSDVFNTLKDHDNEISSPGAGFTAGRMLNKDTSS